MEKKYRVVVKASCEDSVYVIANSEEEAKEKVNKAITDCSFDVIGYNTDIVEYIGGYTTEPVISVEGWQVIKTA